MAGSNFLTQVEVVYVVFPGWKTSIISVKSFEGKGKMVDALAADTDICVRCAGGNNAGHAWNLLSRLLDNLSVSQWNPATR